MNPDLLIPLVAFLAGLVILVAVGIWALRQGGRRTRAAGDTVPLLSAERNDKGQWIIRVAGEAYPSLKDVPDEATRQEVLAAMRAIVVFARDYVRKPEPARSASGALFVDEESRADAGARAPGAAPSVAASQSAARLQAEPPVRPSQSAAAPARPSATSAPGAPAPQATPSRPSAAPERERNSHKAKYLLHGCPPRNQADSIIRETGAVH